MSQRCDLRPPGALWPPVPLLPLSSLPSAMRALGDAHAPWSELTSSPPGALPPSAVLLLLIPGPTPGDPAAVVFTRRSAKLRSHRGQISFPGGRAEAADASPAATALRELEEELGVASARVQIVGLLPWTPANDSHRVYPVVGLAHLALADLLPQADEVAAVFAAPWPNVGSAAGQEFAFNLFGHWHESTVFPTPGGKVWGLTARMLRSAALA